MSLTQYIVSPACTSKQCTMSCAALIGKPQCVCTAPLGRPGRARGVDDHQRIVGVGPLGAHRYPVGSPAGRPPQDRVPVRIETSMPSRGRHDHVLDRRRGGDRLVRDLPSSAPRCPRRQKPSAVISTVDAGILAGASSTASAP